MIKQLDLEKYLPLTEATYYILLALANPLHGYGIMQKVDEVSTGMVKLGPGTLYGALSNLQNEGLIEMIGEEDRRKTYMLTEKGKRVLENQVKRLEVMLSNGMEVVGSPK
jgi:DNA-binding PadR family transcriptional regulator